MAYEFSLWTVYERPSDFPNSFVARRFTLAGPTDDLIIGPTLDALRQRLAACGLYMIPRSPDDDPVIVESWL